MDTPAGAVRIVSVGAFCYNDRCPAHSFSARKITMIRRAVLAIAFAFLCTSYAHGQTLYGVTYKPGNPQLIFINPSTGAASLLGNLPATMQPGGMDFRGGVLFVWDDFSKKLAPVNHFNGTVGATINVTGPTITGEGDFAFHPDGRGFLTGLPADTMKTINAITGAATPLGPPPTPNSMSGLAFDAAGTTLYGIDAGSRTLHTINTATGAISSTKPTGIPGTAGTFTLGGLAFDSSGKLYTVLSQPSNPVLYQLNPITAAIVAGPISIGGGFKEVSGIRFAPAGTFGAEGSFEGSSPVGGPVGGEGGFGRQSLRAAGGPVAPTPMLALAIGAGGELTVRNVSSSAGVAPPVNPAPVFPYVIGFGILGLAVVLLTWRL